MAENNNTKMGEKKGYQNYIIAGVVVLVAVVLIIFARSKADEPTETSDEVVPTENGDSALHVGQQVVAGDYTYEFSGIKWIFDTASPEVAGTNQTWLKLEFADFTRNGNAISFGRPYKLGAHPGTCKETDFIDTESEAGIPLGYVVCEGSGVKREFVALQELEKVTVKMRETKGETVGGWQEWYKIDVTEIVR